MRNYIIGLTKTKFAHGLFMAVGGAIGTGIYTVIQNHNIPSNWAEIQPIIWGGIIAGATYILKNMGIGSGQPLPKS